MTIWIGLMFLTLMLMLLLGYPVAFTLGAVSLLYGSIFLGVDFFNLLPLQIWGVMTNFTLLAVPLFILMGIILDKSGLAEDLLETMGLLFGKVRGGLAISVVLVGALLAATTGVVGATVVTMGVIALPTMLKRNYSPQLATGTIAAAGTLGQNNSTQYYSNPARRCDWCTSRPSVYWRRHARYFTDYPVSPLYFNICLDEARRWPGTCPCRGRRWPV